uniref:Cl1285_-2 n=1 Tax=Arundo donax TaxID=35708 RepID=A0A0A9EN76_ARUDO
MECAHSASSFDCIHANKSWWGVGLAGLQKGR